MLQSLPLVIVLVGLTLYTVLGGADFGAGLWQLTAGRPGGRGVSDYAHRAMAPVWEANHVWLIFVLTVFWTAYPTAFGSIASTLAVPLLIALVGIILRGTAYAVQSGARTARQTARIETMFSPSSILVPFALGAAIGAVATDRVPVGNAAGDPWSSWLSPTSITVGLLAIATSAYLAAVFLAADAAQDAEHDLERRFRTRALGAGVAAGGLAIAGIVVADAQSDRLFHALLDGRALAAVIVSCLAGTTSLLLVFGRRYEPARYAAAVAVAAVIGGWALSRWPTILPGLTVQQAAADDQTLLWLMVVVLAGGAILFPALVLLFRLTLAGQLRATQPATEVRVARAHPANTRLATRGTVACLIAAAALLGAADAALAHAAGVVCLFGFITLGFSAVAVPALEPPTVAPRPAPSSNAVDVQRSQR